MLPGRHAEESEVPDTINIIAVKLPVIRESYFLNILILIISLLIGCFGLFFGLAHFLDPAAHEPSREPAAGVIFVIGLCLLGVVFLIIAFLALKGIIYKIKHRQPKN
jgi:hypothetical protein